MTDNTTLLTYLSNVHRSSTLFRHLLRALLREASYLPDPAARSYHRKHILERFRSYRKSNIAPGSQFARDHDALHHPGNTTGGIYKSPHKSPWRENVRLLKKQYREPHQQVRLLSNGRKELQSLARANLGFVNPLTRALMKTYGRIGPRRWRLLEPYLEQEMLPDADSVRAKLIQNADAGGLDASSHGVPDLKGLDLMASSQETPQLLPKFKAIVYAQEQADLPQTWSNLRLKSGVNAQTIWLRPIPLKRRANMIRRWLNDLKARALPPLDADETKRLYEIVTGQNKHGVRAVKRRAAPQAGEMQAEELELSYAEIITSPLLKVDDSHQLTDRFLRRCLRLVYPLVPTLQFVAGKWRATFPKTEAPWRKVYDQLHEKAGRKRVTKRDKYAVKLGDDSLKENSSQTADVSDLTTELLSSSWMFSDQKMDVGKALQKGVIDKEESSTAMPLAA